MIVRSVVMSCVIVVGASLVPAVPAAAQALPAFSLSAPDGSAASSSVLTAPGRTLLVYLSPGASSSDRLLQTLGESWTAERAARIVFIVNGSTEDAKAYVGNKGGEALAANARWYADTDGAAWKVLGFQGTLAVAGILDGRIDWKLDGVIDDPAVLLTPMNAWLGVGQ